MLASLATLLLVQWPFLVLLSRVGDTPDTYLGALNGPLKQLTGGAVIPGESAAFSLLVVLALMFSVFHTFRFLVCNRRYVLPTHDMSFEAQQQRAGGVPAEPVVVHKWDPPQFSFVVLLVFSPLHVALTLLRRWTLPGADAAPLHTILIGLSLFGQIVARRAEGREAAAAAVVNSASAEERRYRMRMEAARKKATSEYIEKTAVRRERSPPRQEQKQRWTSWFL